MRRVSLVHSLLALLFLALCACRPDTSAAPKYLAVTLVLPKSKEGVFLNESLTIFFSGEVDRASVTAESVSIRAPDGGLARGSVAVNGNSLTFTPAPVLAQDLSDGGYRPDTAYTVQIQGFPWVDGLRGVSGEPLRETHVFSFRTVSAAPPIETLLFVDSQPDKTRPLGFFPPPTTDAHQISADDVLYLDSDKPIDPSSVRDADFALRRGAEFVPVRARLLENESESRVRGKPRYVQSTGLDSFWESQPRAALLELTPVKRLTPDPRWKLSLAPGAVGPRDFSGHVLWNPMLALPITVGNRGRDAGKGVLYEDFMTTRFASLRAVPETDGLARWSANGRVEVRYPAAAGLGTAGHLQLDGGVDAQDVHAISLEVKVGGHAKLASTKGLVVLRAQGALRIAGRITREVTEPENEPRLELRASDVKLAGTLTLTRWLEEMRARNRTLTVLIAGGDLVIEKDAELRSNTPLLLVAGGHVRVFGSVRGPILPSASGTESGTSVWLLGDGGGLDIQPPRVEATLLTMDAPVEGNPLKETLHYAVFSSPIPDRGAVASWTSADAGGSVDEPSANRWSVRYVREFSNELTTFEALAPVDRPQTLEPVGSIQMLIELWVAPGATFEPPFVDFVRLTWESKIAGNGATR